MLRSAKWHCLFSYFLGAFTGVRKRVLRSLCPFVRTCRDVTTKMGREAERRKTGIDGGKGEGRDRRRKTAIGDADANKTVNVEVDV